MRKPKNKIFAISIALATLFIMCNVSPYLTFSGHALRRAWAIYFLWLLTTPFWKPGAFYRTILELKHRRFEVFFLLCWLIVVLLNAAFDHGYTWDLHLLTMLNMTMVVSMGLCYSGQRDGSFELLLTTIFILIGLDVFRSLPTLWSQPGLARMIMHPTATPEMIAEASSAGVGQYGYYTGLAIVLPVIITRTIVTSRRIKTLLWFVIGAILFAIAIATFMGAILLMILGMIFLFFLHIKYTASRLKIIGGYLAVGLILYATWSIVFSDTPQGVYIAEKLADQISGVATEGIKKGDKTMRWDTWAMSFQAFTEHPLLGVGPSTIKENPNLNTLVGGHSSWLDQLAEYGVLGFSFYVLFIFFAIMRLVKNFNINAHTKRLKIVYSGQLVSCFLFVLGGIYNPVIIITEIYTLFYFMSISEPNYFY
jgi:O-antigen ligase